ncbi:hypothetical protein BASA83_013717 [Batrachochytrium salamandrivorans]|nr:hypothetical protein BASA83_013717 [Batrachochytrium salamandrivorans]
MSTKKLKLSTGFVGRGTLRYIHYHSSSRKLNGRADSLSEEDYFLAAIRAISSESLTRRMFWIFKLHGGSISMYWFIVLFLDKKELKKLQISGNTFVRILNDGKSTATYCPATIEYKS